MARRLCRQHDGRGRRRDLLFPLHALPGNSNGGSGFGNFLHIDANYNVLDYPPQYLAAQIITKEWVQPIDAPHKQFKASSDVNDAAGNVLVTAYAVERPDGQWSVMLVNRDQSNDHAVKVSFAGAGRKERPALHRSSRPHHLRLERISVARRRRQRPRRPGRSPIKVDCERARGNSLPDSEGVNHSPARKDRRVIEPQSGGRMQPTAQAVGRTRSDLGSPNLRNPPRHGPPVFLIRLPELPPQRRLFIEHDEQLDRHTEKSRVPQQNCRAECDRLTQ